MRIFVLEYVGANSLVPFVGTDFILMVGNRAMIKRKLFEAYIDLAAAV